jgi:hypothetical protein
MAARLISGALYATVIYQGAKYLGLLELLPHKHHETAQELSEKRVNNFLEKALPWLKKTGKIEKANKETVKELCMIVSRRDQKLVNLNF